MIPKPYHFPFLIKTRGLKKMTIIQSLTTISMQVIFQINKVYPVFMSYCFKGSFGMRKAVRAIIIELTEL